MNVRLLPLLFVPFVPFVASGQEVKQPNWAEIRQRQPAGLELKLGLPKRRFFQGEVIDATLTYVNGSRSPYHVWMGTYDRSGRIPDIAFYAQNEKGEPAADPLAWYYARPAMGGGLGNYQDIGSWSITLQANQWIRFEKPGTYSLFAYSNRATEGVYGTAGQKKQAPLVSDPQTIVIEPLTEEVATRELERIRGELKQGGETTQKAIRDLAYLQTEEAKEELLPYLNDPQYARYAEMGLAAAADSERESQRVLAAVKKGGLTVDEGVISLFRALKKESPFRLEGGKKRGVAEEIIEAAAEVNGQKGERYLRMLIATWTCQIEPDQARAKLVEAQLELTPTLADEIFSRWESWGGEDFLPMVRKLIAAPHYSAGALSALAKLRPEEARKIIIEDIQKTPPLYLYRETNTILQPSTENAALLSLPVTPLPELESYFRRQLSSPPSDLHLLVSALRQYGTSALLPELKRVYLAQEGRWACALQKDMLAYWLRCDPVGGLEAVERALASRKNTGCYRDLLADLFGKRYIPAALPLLTRALDDTDHDVVASAVDVLERNAGVEYIEPSIFAAERLSAAYSKEVGHPAAPYGVSRIAGSLQGSSRWKLSKAQDQRCVAIRDLPSK